MVGFILGQKSEQTQNFNEAGERIPTTFIKVTPCYLIDVRTQPKHGYFSVMLGFGQTKNIKKSIQGQIAKAGVKTPLRFLREFRLDKARNKVREIEGEKRGVMIGTNKIHVGEEIKPAAFFKKGEFIQVSGTSKGKGFQGVVKRHKFAGGPRTHGQSDRERAPGSIGQTTTPGRVYKGKRMAGRMGGKRVTVKNLQIVEVKENGLVIKGLIPGAKEGLVEISAL